MKLEEFALVLKNAANIVEVGIKKEYFREEDREVLLNKLLRVLKNGIVKDIPGTAIYGGYSSKEKRLYYNVKVFKEVKKTLVYVLHEMKHALDDNELNIGFHLNNEEKGVGMNEGATQRFATDVAEEILAEKFPETMQTSLGITLSTNLDEYQIEDKINELFCSALGISRAEFLRMQNENDLASLDILKKRFNEFSDFDAFQKALDDIYIIQEETWIDENGNFLEEEAEPTPEQTERAKKLIKQCQSLILQFVEKSNPQKIEEIKEQMIMIDGDIMKDEEIIAQDEYLKYQQFITSQLNLDLGNSELVHILRISDDELIGSFDDYLTALKESDNQFSEIIYIREENEYKKIEITFDKSGIIKTSQPQLVEDLKEITRDIENNEILGNEKEYIRILQLQGKNKKAQKVQNKYEYFENNKTRIPEIKRKLKENSNIIDIEEMVRMLENGEEFVSENVKISTDEFDKSKISYDGITIFSDGMWTDIFGRSSDKPIPDEIIYNIEQAVEQGELELTAEQMQILEDIKQKTSDQKVKKETSDKMDTDDLESDFAEKDKKISISEIQEVVCEENISTIKSAMNALTDLEENKIQEDQFYDD